MSESPGSPKTLKLSGCVVDLEARVALWPNEERSLTPTELALLAYLASLDGRVASQRELLREVWGYRGGVVSRTVKTTMGRLRAKVERSPSNPEHLITLVGSGYRFRAAGRPGGTGDDLPALRRADRAPGLIRRAIRMPSPFVGYSAEREQLLLLLEEGGSRVITVTGPPGVGKSYLALALGSEIDADENSTVLLCPRPSPGAGGLVHRLSEGIGLEEASAEGIATFVESCESVLFVLDDFDSESDDSRALLARWLEEHRSLRLLVCRRSPLGLPSEVIFPLRGLELSDARELFRSAMGAQALPGYREDRELDPLLGLLDGLPLGIEMAAAWAAYLSPEELARRLQASLELLSSDQHGGPERHASLQAAFRSAWDLLTPVQREVLSQLVVFESAFPLSALEVVVELEGGFSPLPVVRSLIQRSLVVPVESGPPTQRVRLLHAVRSLVQSLGSRPAALERHAAWSASLASDAALESLDFLGLASRHAWVLEVREDLRKAFRWSMAHRAGDQATALAGLLGVLEELRGPMGRLGEDLTEAGPPSDFRLLLLAARSLLSAGKLAAAERLLEPSLSRDPAGPFHLDFLLLSSRLAARRGGVDPVLPAREAYDAAVGTEQSARSGTELGVRLLAAGRGREAERVLELAIDQLRGCGNRRAEARALDSLGLLALERGRPLRARSLFEAALSLALDSGSRRREASVRTRLGQLHRVCGEAAAAEQQLELALEVHSDLGNLPGRAEGLLTLAGARSDLEKHDAARLALDEALTLALRLEDRSIELRARLSQAEIHLLMGHVETSRRHAELAALAAAELSPGREYGLALGLLAELDYACERYDSASAQLEVAAGVLDQAGLRVDLSELLFRAADAESVRGNQEGACALRARACMAEELSRADGAATLIRPTG